MDTQLALFATLKENFDAQCNLAAALNQTAFTGLEKLIELNICTTQTTVIESGAAIKQYLSTEPKQWLSLAVVHCQPAAGKAFDYLRHASSIASETQAQLRKTAEAEITEANNKIMSMVDALAQSAAAGPAGTDAAPKKAAGKASARSGLSAVA